MEQIIVKHPDASTTLLVSKGRTSSVTKAEQTVALLGEDTVAITVKTATPITFYLGDQIEVYGKVYTLNQLPTIKKTGARKFEYDLTFEGVMYELIDAQWLLPDDTVLDSFTGDLEDFLDLLIANINRVFPGKWQLGIYPADTEFKTLTYTRNNCLEVLQNLCEEYNTEFEIAQANGIRTINIKTAGVNFPYTFRYGRTGGLYELTRQNINSKNVVTRLYVYGGSNNLGSKYRYSKLCLPGKDRNASYIENAAAIAAFGLKENTKIFEKVYPNRIGQVTGVCSKYYSFVDSTMNFDLNEKETDGKTTKWLINGVAAKVKVNSGNLAGYEFEIHKYDHATKEIQVVPFTDENGMEFPSKTSVAFQFGVGDKYILTDINLPDAYKTEAEAELQEEGETFYNQYCQPQVQYGLSIDQNFIKQFAEKLTVVNLFAVGDYIPVEDSDLGLAKSVRITGFTRDLLQPYKYSITLGDSVTKTTITRVIEDLQKIDTVIQINDLADPSKARRNWRASQEVLANVFDPDGNYYSEKIRPLSIETTKLATGARSQQFVLQNTRFEPNYNGNANTVKVVGGSLIHYTIDDTIRSWEIATYTTSSLVADTPYYIYARCERAGTSGNIIFDIVQRTVDSDPLYYYFLIGNLSSVITDTGGTNPARLISLTYGASTINGRFVNTGRIQSSGGGTTYFDLDAGEIGGNIKFISSDGTSKNVSDLDSVAQETKDYINNTLPGILSEIQAQLDGQIEQFFETYDPTTSNAPASSWTTTAMKEDHLGDLFYNTETGKVYRWIKNGSVYSWQELQDSEVAQALALANDALALAKTKRRIFTTTPTTPYEVGDLWVQGASGGIYKCKTTRLTGSYSSSDWEVAAKYTDDTALTTFINGSYNTQINDLVSQIDGKIESWFQTSDPSTAWTTAALKAAHTGDMWYSSSTKLLKRYTVSGSTYSWTTIEDQKAIDAYIAAGNAQDTADGKRRVFVAQPYPPYDIGDLWLTGGATDGQLKRCITARASGSYIADDWVIAVYYDNTKTTINGGIVTSGTLQLASSDKSIKAGITGEGTDDSSVRIWAGESKENKASAPYRVTQNGEFWAKKAHIEGEVNATSGTFKGRVEANEGVFYGSVATPPQTIADNAVDLYLSFNNGFNFAGSLSYTKKKIILPTTAEYAGVECSIINYGDTSNGYYEIVTSNGYSFLYSGTPKNRNTISSIKLYGTSQLKVKAIKVLGVIRWFIDNYTDFSFDYYNGVMTNNLPSQMARCIGAYNLISTTTMQTLSCADGNILDITRRASGRWTFTFQKTRPTNKNYAVVVNGSTSIYVPIVHDKTNNSFQIDMLYYFYGAENWGDISGWGFILFEFDV